MADDTENPLVSHKASESPVTVSVHPLVLITASDLLTRHRVRKENGPLAGILLGQQTGQDITAEHAFSARLLKNEGGDWALHQDWMETRIQQFKDVHKAPALEVVGWFTTCPESGPLPEHLTIQKQINTIFSENGIFLALHPSALASSETTNRKLPISIYESLAEGDHVQDDGQMQIDGEEKANIKFRSLPYTIDTDETEMIAIDYVAKGAGSAAAVDGSVKQPSSPSPATDGKGKQKAGGKSTEEQQTNGVSEKSSVLTTEEEDQIAGLTTRLNSVKMLHSRLQMLTKYIQGLPPSHLSEANTATENFPDTQYLPHLRNIQALITRLSLLTPAHDARQAHSPLEQASQSQKNDVALATMLSQLGQDVQGLNELGRKFATIEQGKSLKSKNKGGFGQGTYGGDDDNDGKIAGLNLSSGMLV